MWLLKNPNCLPDTGVGFIPLVAGIKAGVLLVGFIVIGCVDGKVAGWIKEDGSVCE
jgi:hypothetical protein